LPRWGMPVGLIPVRTTLLLMVGEYIDVRPSGEDSLAGKQNFLQVPQHHPPTNCFKIHQST